MKIYLENFKEHIEKSGLPHFPFVLRSHSHQITVTYVSSKNEKQPSGNVWTISNHGQLFESKSVDEVRDKLFKIYKVPLDDKDTKAILSTGIYCCTEQSRFSDTNSLKKEDNILSKTRSAIYKWKLSENFKKIHDVTPEKAKYKNEIGVSWIYIASRNNFKETVKNLILKGADVNATIKPPTNFRFNVENENKIGFSPLIAAASKGHENIVTELVNKGADVNQITEEGDSALHYAAENGHVGTIKILISKGSEINKQNEGGQTPLHDATDRGYNLAIEALIAENANPNLKDKDGNSALHFAVESDSESSVILIINANADVNSGNQEELTPLHYACAYGYTRIAKLLIEAGADVAKRNCNGNSALHFAASGSHNEIIDLLLEKEADVNEEDHKGNIPLHYATLRDSISTVDKLINNKAEINKKNHKGETALYLAVQQNSLEMIRYLINQGADVNAQTRKGNTALHLAAANGFQEATNLLITAGADLKIKNNEDMTPLQVVIETQSIASLKQLVLSESPITAEDVTRIFTPAIEVQDKCSFSEWDISDELDTVLSLARENNNQALIRQLSEDDSQLKTIKLYFAASIGDSETIKKLVKQNPEILNRRDPNGCTALHYAAEEKEKGSIKTLLELNACALLKNIRDLKQAISL